VIVVPFVLVCEAVIVTVNDPVGLEAEVATWRLDVCDVEPEIVTVLGVNDVVAPVSAGVIDAEKETEPASPPLGVTVTPYEAVSPGRMLRAPGETEIAKSPTGGGAADTVTFTDDEAVEAPTLSNARAEST
jgi:hypothetical protein